MLLIDVTGWKNPEAHASHVGWKVTEPAELVYVPGGQLVWARQESVSVLLLDVTALKNPVTHV